MRRPTLRGRHKADHLARLRTFRRYPGCEFVNPDDLAKHIAYSAVLDLLVKDYAEQFVREREVAEGFIREMAKRVAGDAALDLDGMKQAVRNAIEIYETEIAGRPVETNLDDIVGRALTRAKEQVDRGQSGLARATLRRAADAMQREEDERRERYVMSVTVLYRRERDIALASYDGSAAAGAILALARAVHGTNASKVAEFLRSEAKTLHEHGLDRGSNVHLVAAIALRRSLAERASRDERGLALANLGNALFVLGEREAGTAKLEEAVKAYREALRELTRDRVPLRWAGTQNNLGNALRTLGERVSDTALLEEAVKAYREALEERTRERVPLDWAMTQWGLGSALFRLGERGSDTALLKEAVVACREALKEYTRERVPLEWAMTQNTLGNALRAIGARESGTERLEEAVVAFRAALQELTRKRVPLEWAMTQNNLGAALGQLGERESDTAKLGEAVAACRAALEELTRERVPLEWAASLGNQGVAMMLIADLTNDSALAETAFQQIQTAAETLRSGGHQRWAADFEAQLPKAQAIRGRLKGK